MVLYLGHALLLWRFHSPLNCRPFGNRKPMLQASSPFALSPCGLSLHLGGDQRIIFPELRPSGDWNTKCDACLPDPVSTDGFTLGGRGLPHCFPERSPFGDWNPELLATLSFASASLNFSPRLDAGSVLALPARSPFGDWNPKSSTTQSGSAAPACLSISQGGLWNGRSNKGRPFGDRNSKLGTTDPFISTSGRLPLFLRGIPTRNAERGPFGDRDPKLGTAQPFILTSGRLPLFLRGIPTRNAERGPFGDRDPKLDTTNPGSAAPRPLSFFQGGL